MSNIKRAARLTTVVAIGFWAIGITHTPAVGDACWNYDGGRTKVCLSQCTDTPCGPCNQGQCVWEKICETFPSISFFSTGAQYANVVPDVSCCTFQQCGGEGTCTQQDPCFHLAITLNFTYCTDTGFRITITPGDCPPTGGD